MAKHVLAYAVFIVATVVTTGQSISYMVGPRDALEPSGGQAATEPSGAVIFQLAVIVLLVGLFLGVAVLLPRISGWALNIPNKEYWLAPERRDETYGYLTPWFLWFGAVNLLLMFIVFRQAHLSRLGQDDPSMLLIILAGYVIVSMIFVVRLLVRFSGSEASRWVREQSKHF